MIIFSPRPGTPLDRNNRLTNGVTAAYLFSKGTGTYVEDSAYGNGLTLFGNPEWGTSATDLTRPAYMGIKCNGTTVFGRAETYSQRTNGVGGFTASIRFTYGGHNGLNNAILWCVSKMGASLWDWATGIYSRSGSNFADDHVPIFYVDADGAYKICTTFSDMVIGQSYMLHYAMDAVGTTLYVYRDGVFGESQGCVPPSDTATVPLAVGRTETFNDGEMTGDIHRVVVWNRVLSADEIARDAADPFGLWVQDKPIYKRYFVPSGAGAPALSWLGGYPSVLGARQPAAVFLEASRPVAPVAAASVPALSWGPELPDLAPLRPWSAALGGGAAYVTALANLAVPGSIPWAPKHPDRIDARPRPVNEGGATEGMGLPSFPIPLDSFLPRHPDRIDPPRRPVDEGSSVSQTGLSALPVPSHAGWRPVHPDFLLRPGRAADGGAFDGLAALSALPAPGVSWLPVAPDGAARAPGRPVNEGGPAGLTSLAYWPVPPLGWLGEFPDRVPWAPARAAETLFAEPIAPPGAVQLGQPWFPVFPDGAARASTRVVGEGFRAEVLALANFAVPSLSWQSRVWDSVPRPAPRPVAEGGPVGQVSLAAYPVPGVSWLPSFPDGAARAAQRVAAWAHGWGVLTPAVLPPLTWLSSFPDAAVRAAARSLVEGGQGPGILARANFSVPGLAWLPFFTDGAARAASRVVGEGHVANFINTSSSGLTPLAWGPRFVDFPGRAAPRPVDEGHATAILALANFGIPALSWRGEFPDGAARGPRQPVREGGPAGLPFLPTYPVPGVSWLGLFPDQAPRRKDGAPETQFAWASGLPNLAVPALSWAPRHPDFLLRAQGAREGLYELPLIQPLPPSLAWAPVFSGPVPPHRLRETTWAVQPVAPVLPAAPLGAWYPIVPGPVLRVPAASAFQAVPVAPPAILQPMWGPTFPDFARRAPMPLMLHSTGRTDPPPPPPPVPLMSWQGVVPAYVWVRAPLFQEGVLVEPLLVVPVPFTMLVMVGAALGDAIPVELSLV